jgi:iron complex transport system ATP-binding protein
MGALLEVKNLSCGYDENEVINGISFTIEEKDFLGIIGPNGAGKTTLFRALTRILKPLRGTVHFQGRNLADVPRRETAKEIAVLPQMLDTCFSFPVGEFVQMGRFPHLKRLERHGKSDREAVDGAMSLAGVLPLRHRLISELSGGERQRVLIAQALAQQPWLLLLDEPTTHLDIGHQVEILDLLKKLNSEEGLAVAMILHDLNLASEYCDRIILLKNGEIFRIGSPQEVLTYQSIEEVYNTVVVVKENPISLRPHVLLVPKDRRGNLK